MRMVVDRLEDKMPTGKCRRCKCEIFEGLFCAGCKEIRYQEEIEKRAQKRLDKIQESPIFSISKIKSMTDPKTWCSDHANCFRCSIGKSETDEHIRAKFERYLHHRRLGSTVFTELRLKHTAGGGRPDLIIMDNKGKITIEEVAVTEKEASLDNKKQTYPFPVTVVRPKTSLVGVDLQ